MRASGALAMGLALHHRLLLVFTLLSAFPTHAVDDATRLETAEYLSEQMEAILQAGERPPVWLTVLGERKTFPILSCTRETLTVEFHKNPFPVKWKEISPEDMAGIAKSIAAEKGERMVVAAEVANMLGFSDKATDLLAAITNPDESLKEKMKALGARIIQTEKNKAPAPPTPPPASGLANKKSDPVSPATPASPASPASATASTYVPPPGQQPITGPVILVGPTRPITTITAGLAKAKAGDTVLVDLGTYKEAFKIRGAGKPGAPVTLRGMIGPKGERPVIDCAGVSVSGAGPTPRAAIQIEGSYCVVDGFEIKNARNGNNGTGVRFLNSHYAVLRNSKITYCDMGIMGGDLDGGIVERCEVAFNGTKDFDGYSHNFYMHGVHMILRECYIHDSLFGQNVKSRTHFTELWYNFIADSEEGEIGFVDSEETAIPNSNALLVGNVIVSKENRRGNPSKYIHFSAEGGKRDGDLFLFNNTFIAGTPRVSMVVLDKLGSLTAMNNIFYGTPKVIQVASGKIKGSNNCIFKDTGRQLSATLNADPLFVNPAARDFHLQPGSPCANAGLIGDALTYTDGAGKAQKITVDRELIFPLDGKARNKKATLDIGAFGL